MSNKSDYSSIILVCFVLFLYLMLMLKPANININKISKAIELCDNNNGLVKIDFILFHKDEAICVNGANFHLPEDNK